MTLLKTALHAEENNVVHSLMDFRDRMGQHLVHAKQKWKNSLHSICAIQQSQVTPHFLGRKKTAIKIPVYSDITELNSYHNITVN